MLFKPKAHIIVVNKLALVRLSNSFPDSGTEAIRFFDQTQGRFFHKMLSVHPVVGGDPRKLRFLLWREMDFHVVMITKYVAEVTPLWSINYMSRSGAGRAAAVSRRSSTTVTCIPFDRRTIFCTSLRRNGGSQFLSFGQPMKISVTLLARAN